MAEEEIASPRVVVTGAGGFAGRALCVALQRRGVAVVPWCAPHEDPSGAAWLRDHGFKPESPDLTDEAALTAGLQGVRQVVHGAWRDEGPPEALVRDDLVASETLLAAARGAGVYRLVLLSSEVVTRGWAPRTYADEDFPPPVKPVSESWRLRALVEDLVLAAHGGGIETISLRPAWLWGAGDTENLPALARSVRVGRFRWLAGGRTLWAGTHRRTLVAAVLRALDAPGAGGRAYHVTDDERLLQRDFLGRWMQALGLPVPRAGASLYAGLLGAWLQRGPRREAALRALYTFGRSAHFNVQRAREVLGWAPAVTTEEGLRELSRWCAALGGLEATLAQGPKADDPSWV
ncbi:MAG: NAD-dependent epimerase/dehydratase family protein [Deltaproteobacteria bacterium]|nr:NAD-dependent epimerase/dehydratase family protein [Deltaproteobacteria bacterium]